MIDSKAYGLRHHSLLHWARVDGIMYHTTKVVNDHKKSKVMLMISSVIDYTILDWTLATIADRRYYT